MQQYSMLNEVYARWQLMQPLSKSDADRLSRRFSLDFNYNSNHIEGNTLTYGQTELLLLFGRVVGDAHVRDIEEMKASSVGMLMMQEEAEVKDYPLTETFIRQLHKTLLRDDYEVRRTLPGGVITSYAIHAGRYKTRPNSVITRYGDRFDYASPEETPALMSDLVRWYNDEERRGEMHPVDLATLFHYRYIRIHPFEDGNGRIARLMVNYILARHDYPMIVVRSRKKRDYLEALHQADMIVGTVPSDGASATLMQIKPFRDYFVKLVTEEIAGKIDFLTSTGKDSWRFDGERISFRSKVVGEMLRAMHDNPYIKVSELSALTGVSRTAIKKNIASLVDKGYIMQHGANDPSWHLCIVNASW